MELFCILNKWAVWLGPLLLFVNVASAIECKTYTTANMPANFNAEQIRHAIQSDSLNTLSTDYPTVLQCAHPDDACMVIWNSTETNDTAVIISGCWDRLSADKNCDREKCVAHQPLTSPRLKTSNPMYWCCCKQSLCNENFEYNATSDRSDTPPPFLSPHHSNKPENMFVIMIAVLCVVCMLVSSAAVVYYYCRSRAIKRLERQQRFAKHGLRPSDIEGQSLIPFKPGPQPPQFFTLPDGTVCEASSIVLLDNIARGRYGKIYLAKHANRDFRLAIKAYEPASYYYFQNEKDVYGYPLMVHPNILACYGALEVDDFGGKNYWLATEYIVNGSLHDFLKAHTLSWDPMLSMCVSVARGLGYLHTDVKQNGQRKPAIAHRDINSRNVLVKPDGACVLCDFGFAIPLEPEYLRGDGKADEVSLPEVGTVRYMAPEVLDGAVNLRDPLNALKQVDVYSLGLVLWEILSRCGDLYTHAGEPVPNYQLPYTPEVGGQQPSLEQMQMYVCKKKARPLFPRLLDATSYEVLKALRMLIEDLWDCEAEARISALCAHERLVDLQAQQFSFKACAPGSLGPVQGMNPSSLVHWETNRNVESGVTYIAPPNLVFEGSGHSSLTSGLGSMSSGDRVKDVNIGATTAIGQAPPPQIQPYQDRNPSYERNTYQESSDESGLGGRVLESDFDNKMDPCALMEKLMLQEQSAKGREGTTVKIV